MFQIERSCFEELVRQAVDELPETLRAQMVNVVIVVQGHPSSADLMRLDPRSGHRPPRRLYGLYQGVPLPLRGTSYDKVLPDLITIYQSTHEQTCDSLEELQEEVRATVRHEIAHHFGIDDDRLDELGL